jgi:hydroxyethylthiazole kinase-like uncharacterized protein yjeF
MQRILPTCEPLALFDIAQTRTIEQHAMAGLPPHRLMRRAGLATARLALAIAPHAGRVWIAAGPGNNGGDGLEAALHLLSWGKQVALSLVGDAALLPDDARDALARALAAGVAIDTERLAPTEAPDLAIDALLGIGASRAPTGPLADMIKRLNALRCPVLAVDLPSGLNADTGQPLGEACVTAQHTLALLTLKPGLFTGAGRDHAGCVWLDRLEVDGTAADAPRAWLAGPARLPARRHAQHKGSFGDVAVVGGARGMAGAALLAARAAHAAGAGRVFVHLLDGSGVMLDAARPELMFRDELPSPGHITVVCGCGGGDAVRPALPRLLSSAARLVLDADALNATAADTALQTLLHARAARGLASVLTPHPLEAARLLGRPTAEVQADRLGAAQQLAERYQCCVVLKGSGTIVAGAGQAASINPTGNAGLATAGSGDVLAGWLGGLWSQQGDSDTAATAAHRAASAAVWMHGAAAEPAAEGPLRAADLIERLHAQRYAAPR